MDGSHSTVNAASRPAADGALKRALTEISRELRKHNPDLARVERMVERALLS